MKLREHRGSLADSMATVIEIPPTKTALKEAINAALWPYQVQVNEEQILVDHMTFDERIGWNTYIVYVKDYGVFGFTNELPKG